MVVKVKKELPSPTLFNYLKKNIDNNVVTHVITATPSPTGVIEINIQAANAEGEKIRLFVKENRLATSIDELVKEESRGSNLNGGS